MVVAIGSVEPARREDRDRTSSQWPTPRERWGCDGSGEHGQRALRALDETRQVIVGPPAVGLAGAATAEDEASFGQDLRGAMRSSRVAMRDTGRVVRST